MNKTKIIATVGPQNYKENLLEELINHGTDVIRLNMSYSDYTFSKKIIQKVKEINEKQNQNISIMIDLQGPCIRTGKFLGGSANFKEGDRIRMYMYKVNGNPIQFSVNYSKVINDLKYHSTIKLSEGKVIMKVVEKGLDYAVLEVKKGGIVEDHSKVYFPGVKINRKFLTDQDREDIIFANQLDVDFIGISNVSDFEDVLEVNDLLIELGNDHIGLLAKIQNDKAVKNIDNIIDIADGIIMSRNDMSIEIPIEEVPNVKKSIVRKCHTKGKVSIITAELNSFLTKEVTPSRSEVSDLSNSVSECIDAIMLTSETTIGTHPIEAVSEIEKVLKAAEREIDYEYFFNTALKTEVKNIAGTIASSVALGAIELKSKAIIIATNSGYTAKQMSRLRPPCTIIAASPNRLIARSLNLHFGVLPIVVGEKDFDAISEKSTQIAKKLLNLKKGDKVIITGGYPFKKVKHTNFMKIDEI